MTVKLLKINIEKISHRPLESSNFWRVGVIFFIILLLFSFFFDDLFRLFAFIVIGKAEEMTGKGTERGDDTQQMGHRQESNLRPLQKTDSLNTWGACSTN